MKKLLYAMTVLFIFYALMQNNAFAGGTADDEKILQNFPDYPNDTKIDFAISDNYSKSKKITKANFLKDKGIENMSYIENSSNNTFFEIPEGKNIIVEKQNVLIPDKESGNISKRKGEIVLEFENLENLNNMDPKIAIENDSVHNSFTTINVKKLKLNIKFYYNDKEIKVSDKFHMAMGFADIDANQEVWGAKKDIVSDISKWNNKYYYGNVTHDQNDSYHKFIAKNSEDYEEKTAASENANAILGMNISVNNGDTATFIFKQGTGIVSTFIGNFLNDPKPDDRKTEVPASLTYKLPSGRVWSDGTSGNYIDETFYNDEIKVYGKDIKDKVVSVTDKGDYVEKVTSVFNGNGTGAENAHKGWKYESNSKMIFDSSQKIRVFWNGNKNAVPIFSEKSEKTYFPDLEIGDASSYMGMDGGYTYRTNTSAFFSFFVIEDDKNEVLPKNKLSAMISILGNTYSLQKGEYIVVPKGGKQLVYIPFKTGTSKISKAPVKIELSYEFECYEKVFKRTLSKTLYLSVEDPKENTPPDTSQYENDKKMITLQNSYNKNKSYQLQSEVKNLSWSLWEYKSNKFTKNEMSAKVKSTDLKITNVKRSGYGFETKLSTSIEGDVPFYAFQRATYTFPEFNYEKYNRMIVKECESASSSLEFNKNLYSKLNSKTHFIPLWFPDGSYKVYGYLRDAWTPRGEIKMNISAETKIEGSLYDDWHITY